MKRITRIFFSFCLMLMLSEGVKGQSVRIGVEGNIGLGPYYKYDRSGFFEDKERANILLYSANIYYDIIFPRYWTPNWMALSTQIGMGFMQMENNDEFFYSIFDNDGHSFFSRGINLPLNFEIKFLLSDNVRLFFNTGVVNYITLSYDSSNLDDDLARFYMFGYNYGIGFEFGALRVGYKLTNFTKTILKENIGNKYRNIHTLSMGIMFNGNRFLKKESHLKVY